ncbi:hypothetical protein [Nocardia neocaledoniensis]|uniref:hypothetical protein n=1 Tax=Nocardia neocaledoniensis TaxID=236511 RepID=UPI0024576373|nr:hypothetical protein [Nocardia neocaledoniensis]
MGYPYGPQQGADPYAGGYAQPGYAPDPYAGGYAQPGHAPGSYAGGYAQPGYAPDPYAAQVPYGAAQPHPHGYGYGAPYGYGQPRPSGGTAITAAVIALLISLVTCGGMAIAMVAVTSLRNPTAANFAPAAGGLAVGLLWLLGSILLFRRKTAGRVILILLSSIALIGGGIATAIGASGSGEPAAGLIGGLVGLSIPFLILVMAAAPSTGRWIRAGRQSAYPY